VVKDGAADRAGIKPGDVVTSVDGQEVTNDQTLSYIVANIAPGKRIAIDLLRDGKPTRVFATVAKRPSDEELSQQQFDPDSDQPTPPSDEAGGVIEEKLGLQVLALTPQIARQLGASEDTKGLVIGAVDPNADAGRKGLQRGDIVLSANYREVGSIADLEAIVADAEKANREAVLLRIQRRGRPAQYVPVRLR
jgi:serine protease Do